jgi:hypothetical protein
LHGGAVSRTTLRHGRSWVDFHAIGEWRAGGRSAARAESAFAGPAGAQGVGDDTVPVPVGVPVEPSTAPGASVLCPATGRFLVTREGCVGRFVPTAVLAGVRAPVCVDFDAVGLAVAAFEVLAVADVPFAVDPFEVLVADPPPACPPCGAVLPAAFVWPGASVAPLFEDPPA